MMPTRKFLLPVLAGLGALVGAVWLAVAEPPRTLASTAKPLPARGPQWSPDLGPELATPTSRQAVALRERPKTELERGRLDALLGGQRHDALPHQHLDLRQRHWQRGRG